MPVTEEDIDRICEKMRVKGLPLKGACAAARVNFRSVTRKIYRSDGKPPERTDWFEKIEEARAGGLEHWVDELKKGMDAKNTAAVTGAKAMLFALDKRHRPDRGAAEKPVVVNIYFGTPGEADAKRVEAVQIVNALPEGSVADEHDETDPD